MNLLPFEKIKRDVIVRIDDATTDDNYGCYPDKRSVLDLLNYGIVNVDKPQGPTSHQVSEYVKKMLNIQKSGHSGTLDPNVFGCLPVALGKSTRVVQALINAGKEYVCVMHIHDDREEDEIRKVISEFIGEIEQLPPKKCAIKRQLRKRTIYYIDILDISEKDVLFKVGCEAGTYIRKLCTDIGDKLGCGAHMAELRRTKAGPFNVSESVALTDLLDSFMFFKEDGNEEEIRRCILPFERAVDHLPKVVVLDTTINSLSHGAQLNVPGIVSVETGIEKNDMIAVMSMKGELIGLGFSEMTSEEIATSKRGCVLPKLKIFVEEDLYPKYVKDE